MFFPRKFRFYFIFYIVTVLIRRLVYYRLIDVRFIIALLQSVFVIDFLRRGVVRCLIATIYFHGDDSNRQNGLISQKYQIMVISMLKN